MFVYSEWEVFCKVVAGRFNCIRADQIISQSQEKKWLVIKHDVETDVQRALDMALIENKFGITATYYFQSYLLDENWKLLKQIEKLGHEVTYHYDVLDSNNGNFALAKEEFELTVAAFRNYGFNVKTVCPHGNPIINRNGWSSNKDFFRNEKVQQDFPTILDIIVQLPKLIGSDYIYISDAGYGWKNIVNIKDNDRKNNGDVKLDLDDVPALAEKGNLIISAHPHRWRKHKYAALYRLLLFKIIRKIARILSSNSFCKKIMSRYYHLAKKV